jgi:hypothetical protein
MVIDGYFIGGYWCLSMVVILVPIGDYFIGANIGDYWWLLMVIVLVVIGEYFIVNIDGY